MSNKFLDTYPQLIPLKTGDIIHHKTKHRDVLYKIIYIKPDNSMLFGVYLKCIYSPHLNYGKLNSTIFISLNTLNNDYIRYTEYNPEFHSTLLLHNTKVKLLKHKTLPLNIIGTVLYKLRYNQYEVKFIIEGIIITTKCHRKHLEVVLDELQTSLSMP